MKSAPHYVLDQEYADRKTGENEFHRWLRVKNTGGMRPLYRTKRSSRGVSVRDLAALVLVSRQIHGAAYNPWDDVVDRSQGRIWYWGDAKAHRDKGRDDWTGNQYLAGMWEAAGRQRWSDLPPILHFSKDTAGAVRFNGVCVLAELADAWFEDKGKRVRNFRATLDILPIDRVELAWVESRRTEVEVGAPRAWSLYASTGVRQRLKPFAKLVRKRDAQLPRAGSAEWKVLQRLHGMHPLKFENLVVRAFRENEIAHVIEATPPTKDGGFDFFGSFTLPPPLDYSIPIKGEVKRYEPGKTAVGPKDVSRLVARLQRGQHGVFVTTSYFTEQAQEEVLSDQYPVELISGDRLVGMLQGLGAVSNGVLSRSWDL